MHVQSHPKEILKIGSDRIKIVWDDTHESVFGFSFLRKHCPCALCVDEWTGKSFLDPAAISPDIKADKMELVGHYAVAFQFSDGHGTGIFSFENLRKLCPCLACAVKSC